MVFLYVKYIEKVKVFEISLSSFPASQNTTTNVSHSILPSSTEPKLFEPSVTSQPHDKTVGVQLTPSPALSLTTRASPSTEVSGQGGFLSPSLPSFLTPNASSLISEWITFLQWVSGFRFKEWKRKLRSKSSCLLKLRKYKLLYRWEDGIGISI